MQCLFSFTHHAFRVISGTAVPTLHHNDFSHMFSSKSSIALYFTFRVNF